MKTNVYTCNVGSEETPLEMPPVFNDGRPAENDKAPLTAPVMEFDKPKRKQK